MMIRLATTADVFKISKLYYTIYADQYPDRTVYDFSLLEQALANSNLFWVVAEEENKIVGSVIYIYEPDDLLAKVYGACVLPDFRGQKLTESMMDFGQNHIELNTRGVDIIYATTRTLNPSAQKLTEKVGYKKLGIFPNVHKTSRYETHGLVAYFGEHCFDQRFTDYTLHPEIKDIYQIIQKEIDLSPIQIAENYKSKGFQISEIPYLEIIKAPEFVKYRYQMLKKHRHLHLEFFPFHEANILITSPDQSVELYINLGNDGYCAILGGKVSPKINYQHLILRVADMLRDYGARYLEIIIRADQIRIVDNILKARFIPSAFFPAFQLIDGMRYDFIVFSRSFEIFDFQNVELEGRNAEFLAQYYNHWKRVSLNPKLLNQNL